MTPLQMQLIGLTAAIDAVLVVIAWAILRARHPEAAVGAQGETMVGHFIRYLVFTFVFLVLIALAMLALPMTVMPLTVMIADVVLWVALAQMVLLATVGRSPALRRSLLVILLALGFSRTLYQLLGIIALSAPLPSGVVLALQNMDSFLMYAIWVPVGVACFFTAVQTADSVVRTRSLMFALGLWLTTYSWVARLQLGYTSIVVVSFISVAGFALLLGGVFYRRGPVAPPLAVSPA